MNSSQFHDKCREFDKKRIDFNSVKPRWFRNWYVLYQGRGYFEHKTFVFSVQDIKYYPGAWYGPFFKEDAEKFAKDLKKTYTSFMLYG